MRGNYDRDTKLREPYASRAKLLYVKTRLQKGFAPADKWMTFVRSSPGRRAEALDYWQACMDRETTGLTGGWWTVHPLDGPPSAWSTFDIYTGPDGDNDPLGSRNRPGWGDRHPSLFEKRRVQVYGSYLNQIAAQGGMPLPLSDMIHMFNGRPVDREMSRRMIQMGPPPEIVDKPRGALRCGR